MDINAYIDEIKLDVTGGILELEIDDSVLVKILNSTLREIQRYIDSTRIITIPYQQCIDLSQYNVNAITHVYRANADSTSDSSNGYEVDPMVLGLYQLTAGGNMANFNDYISRYSSWNILQQISNTSSTDLDYYYEDAESKLYINTTINDGSKVTIEFIPRLRSVEDITSDYWIDITLRMAKAKTKIALGTIRSRYTQSNALWSQNGREMLEQGQNELDNLRDMLLGSSQLIYPKD